MCSGFCDQMIHFSIRLFSPPPGQSVHSACLLLLQLLPTEGISNQARTISQNEVAETRNDLCPNPDEMILRPGIVEDTTSDHSDRKRLEQITTRLSHLLEKRDQLRLLLAKDYRWLCRLKKRLAMVDCSRSASSQAVSCPLELGLPPVASYLYCF